LAAGQAEPPFATYPGLAGKVALVTGGSKGIGAATVRGLAANGAKVIVSARTEPAVSALVADVRASGGEAWGICADAGDPASVAARVERARAAVGPIDVLAAFAGGYEVDTPILDITLEEWNDVMARNATSAFLTVQAVLPDMVRRRSGSIVTMASNGGRLLDIDLTASYAAAKAAVVMFTRHVAREVGVHGVRANCIAPATTLSERVEQMMSPAELEAVTAMSPLRRIGTPHDSAQAALFLASDAASWLTGITIDVAGGRIML
jgi:3-oxoacyl-[acyl-carrier protein] reductase